MSNILNHNRIIIDFILSEEDYWDFHLSQEMGYGGVVGGLTTECLSAYIDFNDPNCVLWDDAFSKSEYVWKDAINENVLLDYIGVTGVDNGFITYQKDRITNKEFLNIFLNSEYNTSDDGVRLNLRKVNGNNQIYDYRNELVQIDNKDVARLNGGFYQGFFKIYDKKYQILPYVLENGWSLEVKLMKSDLENEKLTINDTHSENKGIFLYIGTRAENKWWEKYITDVEIDKTNLNYVSEDYIEDGYTSDDGDINSSYVVDEDTSYSESACENDWKHCKKSDCKFIEDGYVTDEYFNSDAKNRNKYFEDAYLEDEEVINGNETILTKDGIDFNQPNVIKYETDNKFLLFNRTSEGFTTKTWEEGTKATIYDIKKPQLENYHTLFNRTPYGYTIKTINDLINVENKKYDILNDLYRNALCFQIKDNGSIGFKYLVKDCETENGYKVIELFSNENVIKNDEWYTVSVKIIPTRPKNIETPICDNITTSSSEEMVIYIYVNGKLKLKSENLPILNLRALNDLSEKQQGVPFSLSLGGGTQGLCDVINLNYRELPKYILPLEKEFCGSFIGYIQLFRFYTCPLNFTEIKENYKYDSNI